MIKKCMGCGIPLQNEDSKKIGYTLSLEMDYCQRCFRLSHYHELDYSMNLQMDNEKLITELNQQPGFAFFFIDFLNLTEESISLYQRIKKPKVLMISKVDLIPESIYYGSIKNWLRDLGVKEEILFLNHSHTSIKKMMQIIRIQKEKNIYFLGLVNAGKSTYVNLLLNEVLKSSLVTVSEMPNTTLDCIQIPFIDDKVLIDTVGFTYSMVKLSNQELEIVTHSKEIKPIIYQLKEQMGLKINALFSFIVSNQCNVVFFGSDELKITRLYQNDFENSLNIKVHANSNLTIHGVCFLYFKEETTIKLTGLKENEFTINPSFLGGNHE